VLTRILWQNSTQSLLDLVLPPRCIHCQTAASWFCPNCVGQVILITGPVCERCGTPLTVENSDCRQCRRNPLLDIDGIRSASFFEDNPIRSAIHFLKYRNHQAVAAVLGQILAEAYQRYRLLAQVIVPVPLHAARLRERGYNQSELLARQIGYRLNLPVNTSALQRTRSTQSQMTLGYEERHRNVSGAFTCAASLTGQTVLLVDDVCTTGSTLDACAQALKSAGAAAVWGLTLAKAA
jgi:ComF family protein